MSHSVAAMKHTIQDAELMHDQMPAKRSETENDNACCFGMVRLIFHLHWSWGDVVATMASHAHASLLSRSCSVPSVSGGEYK